MQGAKSSATKDSGETAGCSFRPYVYLKQWREGALVCVARGVSVNSAPNADDPLMCSLIHTAGESTDSLFQFSLTLDKDLNK